MNGSSAMKTALVHHWLVTPRGGEKVFSALADLFPDADLFALLCQRSRMKILFGERPVHTSVIQFLPKATSWYPYYLPFFPMATERLDLSEYSIVISSDAATVKGVHTSSGALHICYCHTPMRYVWHNYEDYSHAAGPIGRFVYPALSAKLRDWDFQAAQKVTHFIASSHNVACRIRRYYHRESTVIYPPVDTDYFHPGSMNAADEFFLAVSAHVPYKRLDLAVEAFNRNGKRLIVIGDGSERRRLEHQARPNIRFLGSQPATVLRCVMQRCRALVFPGEEDFGIVMVEAQACGKPVIAFGQGGACEIVNNGVTGVLFENKTADSLCDAVRRFGNMRFDPHVIRASALRFDLTRFRREFSQFVESAVKSAFSEQPCAS